MSRKSDQPPRPNPRSRLSTRSWRTLLSENSANVNTELEQKSRRGLEELEAEGLTPADASMAQIVRRIALLEERSKSLTGPAYPT